MDFRKKNVHLIPDQVRSSCLQIFYKIGVLKNFKKYTGKHLHLKEAPAQVFSCEFYPIFQKTVLTEHLRTAAPTGSLVQTSHTFSFFPFFYLLIIDNYNYGSLFREGVKINIFFTFNNNLSEN